MKKILSVMKYILLSLAVFLFGVMIEVSPVDFAQAVIKDLEDQTADQKKDPDIKKDQDKKDIAQADDDKEKEPKENFLRYYYSLLDNVEKNCYDKI